MSSYILGDSWPERPSWTRYMKESTYRHDFGKTKDARDDMRIPITQNANYNQGPYTDRDRRYERYDDRNGPSERRQGPYENRDSDMYAGRGAQTDRGDYGRGRMEDRYDGPRETNRSPERNRYGQAPANYEQADMYDKYGNNRTTQKDYGDFNQQRTRAPVDRPHAYRGKVDEEIDAFHNKKTDIKTGNKQGNSNPKMAESHRTYDSRLRFLERDIVNQRGKLENHDTRNDTHSAKLKFLERELDGMKAENEALFDEVVNLKSDGIRSRLDNEYRYEYPQKLKDDFHDKYKYTNSSLQHNDKWMNKENDKRDTDSNTFQSIVHEEEIPESLRLHGYYRFKAIPYQRQMLLNDNYELISPRGAAQRQKEYDRIEMHEGNFKPYASQTYHKHLTNRDAVRHRNMEYAYDQQQRLPLNIAPQRDYKHNLQRPDPTESGAYLFIRANKNNFHEIKTSFQKHKSVLHLSGVLKGIALNNKISVLDDFTNWNITQPIRKRGEVFYDQGPGNKGKEYSTDYIIVCLWFPSVEQARKWIDYDKDFQNAQFPDHNGVDMLIVPINYLPSNDVDHNTFVMTEYQDVVDKDGLNRYVREPIDDILRKDSNFRGCDPFVVWTEDVKQRRLIVSPRSFVSIHRFNSMNQAMDYINDARVDRIKRELRGITRSGRQSTVIFQLGDFV